MTFPSASTNALHRLLKEATRKRAAESSELPRLELTGANDTERNQPEVQKLLEQAKNSIADRDDPFRLASELLTYVAGQFQSISPLQGLVATLAPLPRLPSSPSVRLLALCQFYQSGLQIDASNAPLVVAYSEILESLVTSQTSFNSQVYSSLQLQFSRMLQAPPSWMAKLLPVYSLLLVSEVKLSKDDLIALDLFSETMETVERYNDQCDVETTLDCVTRILADAIEKRHDAAECLRSFVLLQPLESNLNELSLAECESLLVQLLSYPSQSTRELTTTARWFRRLAIRDQNRSFARLLLRGFEIAWKRNQHHVVAELGPLLESAMESQVDGHRIEYLFTVFERGEIVDVRDFLKSLERIIDFKQVETLSTKRVFTESALNRLDRLRLDAGSHVVSPDILHSRLSHWRELNSIHRGFTSRLISAKRGPFREPPDLVQFAIDVGSEKSVRYINAKDANQFPGKGFFVTRLKLAKCFATNQNQQTSNGSDPFAIYKKAWPGLAEAIDHFDDSEFVFLRGCLLISCKRRDYLLPSGNGEHYSLVVFNDHFRNPFQEVAYLVPNEGVAKLLLGTQIPYSDFVGFDQRRPDINDQLQSPQSFLQHPLIREKAIDVGGVSAILSGFEGHLNRIGKLTGLDQLQKPADDAARKTAEHNLAVVEWERQSHRYHQSDAGQRRLFELSSIGKRLEGELNQLQRQRSYIHEQVEGAIWGLVDKYTNLHKLFCIAHAYWHRGYTAGRIITTSHIDESNGDEQFATDNSQGQDQLRLETGLDAVANRNSIRMLVQAYEWHAMRINSDASKEDFPILVLCDALQHGDRPDMSLYVDTFDMSVCIEGQTTFFSQGKMAGDDELFWLSTIVPRIQDSTGLIRDLRFYPRTSLGLES